MSSKKFLVRPATHIADDQPTIAFQGAREQRDTTTFLTKLRNCTLVAKELDAKIGSNVFGKFGPMEVGSNAVVPAKGVIMERLALQAAASAASSSSAARMLLARAAPTTPGRQPSQGSGLRVGLLQRSGLVEDIDSQSVVAQSETGRPHFSRGGELDDAIGRRGTAAGAFPQGNIEVPRM